MTLCPCPWDLGDSELEAVALDSCPPLASAGTGAGSDFSSVFSVELELASPSGAKFEGVLIDERSSPSSANTAMIWPTGILEDPASDYVGVSIEPRLLAFQAVHLESSIDDALKSGSSGKEREVKDAWK